MEKYDGGKGEIEMKQFKQSMKEIFEFILQQKKLKSRGNIFLYKINKNICNGILQHQFQSTI